MIDGVQRRVEQHRVDTEPADTSAASGSCDLGEDLVAAPPHRGQTPERRTVLVAARGQPLVGVGHVHGDAHRPAATPTDRQLGSTDPELKHALGVQHPSRIRRRRRGKTPRRARPVPDSSAGADDHLHRNRPAGPAGSTSGACSVSSSTTAQPTSSPARIANSTNPAPGNSTTPATA